MQLTIKQLDNDNDHTVTTMVIIKYNNDMKLMTIISNDIDNNNDDES